VNPSNASISAAHLRSNIIEPLPKKKLRFNTPGEFRLPSTCCACILISFICNSVQRVVYTARHETTHELLGLDADRNESPKNSYAVVHAIYTRDDFNTARRSHKTFVESVDCASRYAPHSGSLSGVLVDDSEDKLFPAIASVWQLLTRRQINSG
jgi:hypothetical protein